MDVWKSSKSNFVEEGISKDFVDISILILNSIIFTRVVINIHSIIHS